MKYKLLLCLLLFFHIISGCAIYNPSEFVRDEYKVLKIYFVTWDTLTRTAMSADRVKRSPDVYMEISEKSIIKDILHIIHTHSFLPTNNGQLIDTRLVLEFINENGETEAYYASDYFILTGDSKKISKLNERLLEGLNVFAISRYDLMQK